MKTNKIIVEGKIMKKLPDTMFHVKLINNDNNILCYLAGKLRIHNIRVEEGDVVDVELSPYDLTRGRIIFRHWGGKNGTFEDERKI